MNPTQNTVHFKAGTAKQRLSEDFKDTEAYLKGELDNLIATHTEQDKDEIAKAYIIRNGKRPSSKFQYLQQAYGIQFPAKIRHIPVLKSMFDAILAIDQSSPLDYKITSRDVESLKSAQEEQKNAIIKEFVDMAKEQIASTQEWYNAQKNGESMLQPEKVDQRRIKKLIASISTNFKSSIEINAQDFLESLIQRLELEILVSILCEDLVTAGMQFYQVKAIEKGKRPLVRVVNPLSIYYRKDPNKKFIKDHSRILIKETINLVDLLANHGHEMKVSDVKRIMENHDINIDSGNKFWSMTDMSYTKLRQSDQVIKYDDLYEKEVTLHYGEWIANTEIEYDEPYFSKGEIKYKKKRKYRKDRYEGYRVDEDIYFGLKRSDFIYRPADDPSECFLTVNGAFYNDRNGKPYSMVLNTEDIADKIDVLHYIWESMIAMSGNKAAIINFKSIPKWLSDDDKDRVIKWIGMVKQGAAVVDPSQPGAADFNNYGQLDLSIDASIGVILEMIKYLEEVAGKITGVSRQMLGSITPQDLKGTTEAAINQSSLVLMPFFFTHNALVKQLLTDVLNTSRLVYSEGFIGSYVLGDAQQKIFSIDNAEFWLADFDIWLSNSGDEHRSIEELKALSIELVKANQIDAMDAISMNTIKSLTKIKESLKKSIDMKEEKESDLLRSELEKIQTEFQKVLKDMERMQMAQDKMKEREMELNKLKVRLDYQVKDRGLDIQQDLGYQQLNLDKKRVELEAQQLSYDTKSAEVKNK